MFTCQKCGRTVGPRVPMNKLVVKKRKKTYPEGTTGYETVKELSVCKECMDEAIMEK